MKKCHQCGEHSERGLCAACRALFVERLEQAEAAAAKFVRMAREITTGPNQALFSMLLAAWSIAELHEQPFEQLAKEVAAMGKEVRAVRAERGAPTKP